jgi:hypothetical protein
MQPPERATDQEAVDWLIGHIEEPCGVNVAGTMHYIRDFYLRQLARLLPTIVDPAARDKAEDTPSKYNWPVS